MSKKIGMKENLMKVDRELIEHKTMLSKCNLKVAENLDDRLAEYHDDDEERELVERNARINWQSVILSWLIGCSCLGMTMRIS